MSAPPAPAAAAAPATRAAPARPGRLARATLALGRAAIGRRFTGMLAELQRAQWLSPDELRHRQDQRLADLLRHAAEQVPFWREVYRQRGLRSDELRTVDDLVHLPIVDKDTFRSRPLEDFCADNVPDHRRLIDRTSGSTGDPFRFVLDRAMMPVVFASHLFYDSWFGLQPFARHLRLMALFTGRPPIPAGGPLHARLRYLLNTRLQAVYEHFSLRRLSTFDVTVAQMRVQLDSFHPEYVMGYTSRLAEMADGLLREGWHADPPLRAIVTIAEPLTTARQRSLETCFGGPIANRYGQREFKFWVAQSEPPTAGRPTDPFRFRFNTELAVAETVHADGSACAAGETGRLLLTSLHNRAMPFLRYDTRDLGALEPASWPGGRGFPWIARLTGRSQEVFVTPSGRMVDPVSLGHLLFAMHDHVDEIRLFQLEVLAADRVRLLLVAADRWTEAAGQRVQTELSGLIGSDVHIELRQVADIPLERSGKRPIITHRTERPPAHEDRG